jgi:hypothetical protein
MKLFEKEYFKNIAKEEAKIEVADTLDGGCKIETAGGQYGVPVEFGNI